MFLSMLQQDRPFTDVLHRQGLRDVPGIVRKHIVYLGFILGIDNEKSLGVADRSAENNKTSCRKFVHVFGVITPSWLFWPRLALDPASSGMCVSKNSFR